MRIIKNIKILFNNKFSLFITSILIFIISFSNIYSQLYINEILAANSSVNYDYNFYNYSDWIEIYNNSNVNINLNDYWITDDINNPQKFQIGDIIINAYSYLLIWADSKNKDHTYQMHTNFSLDSDGEFIALYNSYGVLLDSVSYSKQFLDISYGRQYDGSSTWAYFDNPTPNTSNNSSNGITELNFAENVNFSQEGGFYNTGLTLEITTQSVNAEIRYTFDGGIPTKTSFLYTSPISITSNTVIRARSYETGKLPSSVITHTYFMDENFHLPVVSLSTNPANFYDDYYGIYVVGKNGIIGNCATEPVNFNQEWYRPVNLELYELDSVQKINQIIELKISGKCSRQKPMKTLAIYARNKFGKSKINYQFFNDKDNNSFKTILLRNSGNDFDYTLLRDGFMHTLIKDRMDIDYQAYKPANVFLNGEYFGIHNIREKTNKHFIESNYGIDADNIDLLEIGWYNNLEVVEGDDSHYNNLIDFVESNVVNDPSNYNYIKTQMDIDEFINYFIANIYFRNEDWPHNNMKFWREKNSNGKWRWILFDTDWGFDLWNLPIPADTRLFTRAFQLGNTTELSYYLIQNDDFKSEFVQRFASHLNTTFRPERVLNILDSLKCRISLEMNRHINRWGMPASYAAWEDNFQIMYAFAYQRVPTMIQQIMEEFNISGTFNLEVLNNNANAGKIEINTVEVPDAFNGMYFDDIPVRIEAIPFEGYKFLKWEGASTETSKSIVINSSSDCSISATFDVDEKLQNIYINEICADNSYIDDHGEYEDWIEIYNANDYSVDIGGLFITDSIKDQNKFKITNIYPDSTTIPPKGFLVFWADNDTEQGIFHLNFKLNKKGEEVGLSQKIGTESLILDSLIYNRQYENTTYGRYKDGENSFQYLIPTPGSSNVTPEQITNIYINEFLSDNDNICTDECGEYEDWIEIYNAGSEPVDIGGLFITDSLGYPDKYRIPSTCPDSTTIAPDGYIVLWADNQPEQGILHLDFKLSRDGEQIGLVQADGTGIIDSLSYYEQYSDLSFGRYADGTNNFQFMPPTPGSSNMSIIVSELYINEFMSSNINCIADGYGEYEDWIEIYNAGSDPVDIGGLFITDSLGYPDKYRIPTTYPDLTTIAPNGYIVLWADNQPEQGILHLDFKLSRDGEQIGLVQADGTGIIDSLTYGEQYQNSSYSRFPDGQTNWLCIPPTPGRMNSYADITNLYINEFMADNDNICTDECGEYEDWIEIYNAGSEPVDIGGLFITDSLGYPDKYRIPSTCPDSTTIAPDGYIVLWADNQPEQGILHLDFKLSRDGEQIGLVQADGTGIIDSLSYYEQYSDLSFGRYADGTNNFQFMPPTPGSSNMSIIVSELYINEFMSSNINCIADGYGEYEDWIEIYNAGSDPVDIGGLFITDSLGYPDKYRIPTTYPDLTTIAPNGYIVLWADNQPEQGILHLDFKLSRDGEQIGLVQADGTGIIDSLTYGEQYQNSSYSRFPDGQTNWLCIPPTPGRMNSYADITNLYINEFMADNENICTDEHCEYDDWIEIYNAGSEAVDIGGLFITDSLGYPDKYRIPSTCPDSTTIAPDGYIVLWADNQPEQGILHLDFKLSRNGEQIGLVFKYGDISNYIDSISYTSQITNISFGKYPDGTGNWEVLSKPTPNSPNLITKIDNETLSNKCILFQNKPNPFKNTTTITFYLPKDEKVIIKIINISGEEIKTISSQIFKTGINSVIWNGTDSFNNIVLPGIYFYCIQSKSFLITRKLLYIR
jgi:hypothetical protein